MEIRKKRLQTCCFTGHRQIPPMERPGLTAKLERSVMELYRRGILYYGAGGAVGFDCLAAQTVLRLRESCPDMKLILVLPCLNQTRGWRAEDVAEYERIKSQADKVTYVSQQYTRDCMFKRNRHLVDNSGFCICYLTKTSGGTAYTVDYAKKQGLTVVNLAKLETDSSHPLRSGVPREYVTLSDMPSQESDMLPSAYDKTCSTQAREP